MREKYNVVKVVKRFAKYLEYRHEIFLHKTFLPVIFSIVLVKCEQDISLYKIVVQTLFGERIRGFT